MQFSKTSRYYHLAGTVSESSKNHSIILVSQLFQDDEEHGKASEFHEEKPVDVLYLL